MLTVNPTVFVVDRDASLRSSLATAIRNAGWSVETFDSPVPFLTRAPLMVESCLVLAIDLPGLAGLDLLSRLAGERTETPIIAIADHGDIPTTVRAMRAGAVEFLVKPFAEQDMVPAIRAAIARSRVVLDQAVQLRDLRTRYDSLSGREREVMARVVAGDLNKRIGAALGISEITVKAHRGKMMRKMRADSLAELVVMALRLDLRSIPATTSQSIRSAPPGLGTSRSTYFGRRPRLAVAGAR